MAGILTVPIHGTEEVLELPKESLPDDPDEIMIILANELAPLKTWLELGVSYYQQRRMEPFVTVMEMSTGEEGPMYNDHYKADKEGRIALLNSFAAYNVQVAARSKSKQKKDQHIQAANDAYKTSDTIDPNSALTWCGKGLVHLAKLSSVKAGAGAHRRDTSVQDHLDNAGRMFDSALECDRTCIPALLGKAAVLYNKRLFPASLAMYKEVLTLNPACPPEVRLGLAHCYAQLKQARKAKAAFERVLSLSPDNVDALVGLAVMEMNTEPDDSMTTEQLETFKEMQVSRSLKLLERAYNASPASKTHAMLLNLLANHFIVRQDLDKAQTLSHLAFQNTAVLRMRSESCYHIARVHHIRGDFEQAQKFYEHSTSMHADFLLPHLGLGQTLIHAKKWQEAKACFDRVLKMHPDNYEVRKMIGGVCARSGENEKALEHFEKITHVYQEHRIDEEVWVEMGMLNERAAPLKAIEYYHKAREATKRQGVPTPPELFNNIAALYQNVGDNKNAKLFYEKALKVYKCPVPDRDGEFTVDEADEAAVKALQGNAVTALYNLGRLAETTHDYAYADRLYRCILRERPNYLDCFSRLGKIAELKGNIKHASAWYVEALMVNPNHADAWTLLARLHLNLIDYGQAQKYLERILIKNQTDAYAQVMLGNIYFNAAKWADSSDKASMVHKYTSHLARALDHYKKVMQKEPTNIYAANGVGIVLAQSGRLTDAKAIFANLREASALQLPHVWVNLAHIHLYQKEYTPAIKLYTAALDKFHNGHDVPLLTCIAKAQFSAAVTTQKGGELKVRDREMLRKCKRTLQKAMHLAPRDYALQFNLALVLKTGSENVMRGVRDKHQEWINAVNLDENTAVAPPFTKADLELVENDTMVMRRLSLFLVSIKDKNAFPDNKRTDAQAFVDWGSSAAEILPSYMTAVDEMKERYQYAKERILEAERAIQQAKEAEKAEKERELEAVRAERRERAKLLERAKNDIVASDQFLVRKSKKTKGDGEGEDFIDDDAARGRLEKNKNKGKPDDELERAIIRGMEIFLAPSDNEDDGDDDDMTARAKDFMNSDDEDDGKKGDEEADEGGGAAPEAGADEEEGPQVLKKKRRRTTSQDSDEEGGEDKEGGSDAEAEGDEAEGGAVTSKKKRRMLDDDEEEEGGDGDKGSEEAVEDAAAKADGEPAGETLGENGTGENHEGGGDEAMEVEASGVDAAAE